VRYDKDEIVRELERLTVEARVAFAAACAERLMPTYRRFWIESEQVGPNELDRALESVWADPHVVPDQDRERFEQRIEELIELIPSDRDEGFMPLAWQPWCLEATIAQDAGIAVACTLRTKLTAEAREAASAAYYAYEALDSVVTESEIDAYQPDADERIITHPLVQLELGRQRRDLGELRAGESDLETTIARLRDRAKAEAATFLGRRT
jgi:uncharacterized protein YjaG (DUF416 family)